MTTYQSPDIFYTIPDDTAISFPIFGMKDDTYTNADGTYVCSASSLTDSKAYYAFTANDIFRSAANRYDSVTGNYIGTIATKINGASDILGEYVQIQLPYSLILKQYNFRNAGTPYARDFTLVGSNDGNLWNIIDSKTDTFIDTKIQNSYGVNPQPAYTYFRFIGTRIGGIATELNVTSLLFMGTKLKKQYPIFNSVDFFEPNLRDPNPNTKYSLTTPIYGYKPNEFINTDPNLRLYLPFDTNLGEAYRFYNFNRYFVDGTYTATSVAQSGTITNSNAEGKVGNASFEYTNGRYFWNYTGVTYDCNYLSFGGWVRANTTSTSSRLFFINVSSGGGFLIVEADSGVMNLLTDSFYFQNVNSVATGTNVVWVHIFIVIDGTSQKVYVNGELTSTTTRTLYAENREATFGIGRNTSAMGTSNIDDLRIYSRVLSDTDIKSIYNYRGFLTGLYTGAPYEITSSSSLNYYTQPAYAFNPTFYYDVAPVDKVLMNQWAPFFDGTGGIYPYSFAGDYTGDTTYYSTDIAGVGSVGGEWIQIKYPVPFKLTSYELSTYLRLSLDVKNLPKTYYILGSNDGTTWTNLQYNTIPTSREKFVSLINNTNYYTYYRMVITNLFNLAGVPQISQWNLYGDRQSPVTPFYLNTDPTLSIYHPFDNTLVGKELGNYNKWFVDGTIGPSMTPNISAGGYVNYTAGVVGSSCVRYLYSTFSHTPLFNINADNLSFGGWFSSNLSPSIGRFVNFAISGSYCVIQAYTGTYRIDAQAGAMGGSVNTEVPADGRWVHIFIVLEGDTRIVYINGVAVQTITGKALLGTRNMGLTYGAEGINNTDDVRVYTRSLSANEVRLLYEYRGNLR